MPFGSDRFLVNDPTRNAEGRRKESLSNGSFSRAHTHRYLSREEIEVFLLDLFSEGLRRETKKTLFFLLKILRTKLQSNE